MINKKIKELKESLLGNHKKYSYACEITLKHNVNGTIFATQELEHLNQWMWSAEYFNVLVDDKMKIKVYAFTPEDAINLLSEALLEIEL